jgi:hypothetical protein
MRQFDVEFEYYDEDQIWLARCAEVRTTLGGESFDALLARMRVVVQDIAEVELGHAGDIKLRITMRERVDEIRAAS